MMDTAGAPCVRTAPVQSQGVSHSVSASSYVARTFTESLLRMNSRSVAASLNPSRFSATSA